MSNVYSQEILDQWVAKCIEDKAYPVEITINIHKNGKSTIEYGMDGRKLRGRFVEWMASGFSAQTNIVPPKNKTAVAFNKMWATPLEELLRQAVYVGGVDYDSLGPKDRYSKLNGLCFNILIKDVVSTQKDTGLTIASPASVLKVGTHVVSNGKHYQRAVRHLETTEEQ